MRASFDASGVSFEAWLSQIADDQPYLKEVENAQHRWWFSAIREAIHELLRADTEAASPPPWAPALLKYLDRQRATVVTFNYDTLLENALSSIPLMVIGGRISGDDIIGGVPPNPPDRGMVPRGDLHGTFRLRKLHGSIDWFWDDRDPTGTSMVRDPRSLHDTAEHARITRTGRTPFIVPPAFIKSRYFGNLVLRQLWREALEAIQAATRVTFVGYSLPLEDRTFASLLTTALAMPKHSDVRIGVADRCPDTVVGHLNELKLHDLVDEDELYSGTEAVAKLVDARSSEDSF